jgi:hypothetical protein
MFVRAVTNGLFFSTFSVFLFCFLFKGGRGSNFDSQQLCTKLAPAKMSILEKQKLCKHSTEAYRLNIISCAKNSGKTLSSRSIVALCAQSFMTNLPWKCAEKINSKLQLTEEDIVRFCLRARSVLSVQCYNRVMQKLQKKKYPVSASMGAQLCVNALTDDQEMCFKNSPNYLSVIQIISLCKSGKFASFILCLTNFILITNRRKPIAMLCTCAQKQKK